MRSHAAAIDRQIGGVEALAVAGGHVAVLLNRLRLFGLADRLGGRALFAWSAGAMAACERIVLFHDSPPQGQGVPEVLESGLGLVRGVVALPHARRRLRLGDRSRVALFARRFAPDRVLAFEDGGHLQFRDGKPSDPRGVLRLDESGDVTPLEVA